MNNYLASSFPPPGIVLEAGMNTMPIGRKHQTLGASETQLVLRTRATSTLCVRALALLVRVRSASRPARTDLQAALTCITSISLFA